MQKFLQRKVKLTPKSRRILIISGIFVVVVGILSWRFTTLPVGISQPESEVLSTAQTVSITEPEIISHLPYFTGLKSALKLQQDPVLTARLVSLVFSVAGLIMFYLLSREWWSRQVAATATVMLGTSFWFLLGSRLIDPQSLNLFWLCCLLFLFLRIKYESKWWQVVLTGLVAGLSFYLPPIMAWLALGLTATALVHSWRANRGRLVSGWALYFASFFAALIPLVAIAIQNPAILADTFGVSALNLRPAAMLEMALETLRALVWSAGDNYPLALNRVGLIDAATGIFLILGGLRTLVTWRLHRSQLMIAIGAVAVLVTILSRQPYLLAGYLMPITYLLVARGLNQFYGEWRRRFPRNLAAKYAALGAMGVLILFISILNLRTFYVAWAANDHVRTQFTNFE